MGLLYTKFHMNFDDEEWKQISNNRWKDQLIYQIFEMIRHDKDFELIFPTIVSYLGINMPKDLVEK